MSAVQVCLINQILLSIYSQELLSQFLLLRFLIPEPPEQLNNLRIRRVEEGFLVFVLLVMLQRKNKKIVLTGVRQVRMVQQSQVYQPDMTLSSSQDFLFCLGNT